MRIMVAASGVLLAGCATEGGLTVRVCGDLAVPADVDAVRITILDGQAQVATGVRTLVACPEGRVQHLPVDHGMGVHSGSRRVVVQALSDGVEVARGAVRTRLDGGATTLSVSVEQDCRGVDCPLGQSCRGGACAVTPHTDEEPVDCGVFPGGGLEAVDPATVCGASL